MLVRRAPIPAIRSLRFSGGSWSLPPFRTAAAACAALIVVIASPHSAHAQAWIGEYVGRLMAQEAQHQCMMGTSLPDAEIAEARGPAIATMAAYWRAVSAMPPQSVRPLFQASRKVRWTSGVTIQSGATLDVVADPLVEPGAQPEAEPEQFVRAVQGATARGVWRVRRASGAAVGAWLADFSRKSGVWKLEAITVFPTGTEPSPVTQYCAEPGDVEPYRARIAANETAREEKRRRKAAERTKRRDGAL